VLEKVKLTFFTAKIALVASNFTLQKMVKFAATRGIFAVKKNHQNAFATTALHYRGVCVIMTFSCVSVSNLHCVSKKGLRHYRL